MHTYRHRHTQSMLYLETSTARDIVAAALFGASAYLLHTLIHTHAHTHTHIDTPHIHSYNTHAHTYIHAYIHTIRRASDPSNFMLRGCRYMCMYMQLCM